MDRSKLNTGLLAGVAGFTGLAASTGALAQSAIDVSDVESAINSAVGPIATIGAAVLVVLVGIKVYKWIRRAL